ncbi:MAG: RNA polymerase sigma-54 factor [Burkholderiaceae bacterium]|nr:MAG: RNA polymerase sigma-54 factor [Burkholderiaceae bacterium]
MQTGLSVRLGQQLVLTPQLQQALHLLQLSTPELQEEIERMVADNPFLEVAEDAGAANFDAAVPPGEPDGSADWDGASDAGELDDAGAEITQALPDDERGDLGPTADRDRWETGGAPSEGPDDDPADYWAAGESLAQHLHFQANLLRLEPEDAAALHFLIDALEPDGYLEDSLAELAATLVEDADSLDSMQDLVQRLRRALLLLQTLDPSGVGAHDLIECLTLQLRARRAETRGGDADDGSTLDTALALCALDGAAALLAEGDADRLARVLETDAAAVRVALRLIGRLEPSPGRRFADLTGQVVVPEIIVTPSRTDPARWLVELNSAVVPTLAVHEVYAATLQKGRDAAHAELRQRLQQARGFVKGVHQRAETVLRVARSIVARQADFFAHGPVALRPLAQRELATELGLHESTISRATAGKYMATPRGTYELKYFFGSSVGSGSGAEGVSGTAAQAWIKQLIAAEDAHNPLSDGQLVEQLESHGIHCARRTVAKYREALRIPAAAVRRARSAP